jgi:hypothetical protein
MRLTLSGMLLLLVHWQAALAGPPRVHFSDLESGPNSGGGNDAGAFVTIYGNGFGAARGDSSVTIGGGTVADYPVWSDSRITVQLGHAATTGDIRVVTSRGASNGIPFTVRAGKIYFVSPSGNDSNKGSFGSPWKTLLKARSSMRAGAITYAMDGISETNDDGQGWRTAMLLQAGGSPGAPLAIVAYPGASVTVGSAEGPDSGIRSKGESSYWVIAGLMIRGASEAITTYGDHDLRIVGNDMTCPNGNGASACVETSVTTNIRLYGNYIHDSGAPNASALYHGVYFSTDTNHVDFGWNTIANIHGGRGLQVHSSPLNGGGQHDPTGHNQYDISIHDNVIHDTQCDGIILATIDPSQGGIRLYNNVIYNAGKGPDNPERSGYWSCINVQSWTNTGPAGSGAVEIFNNTLFACGTFAKPPYANANTGIAYSGPNGNVKAHIARNILNVPHGLPYLIVSKPGGPVCASNESCPWVYGENNVFFGSEGAPGLPTLTGSMTVDPLFSDPQKGDFHVQPGSLASAAGAQFDNLLFQSPRIGIHRK